MHNGWPDGRLRSCPIRVYTNIPSARTHAAPPAGARVLGAVMREVRVMVSGSRSWTDAQLIARTLSSWVQRLNTDYGTPVRPTLIHGGARGADKLADQAAQRMGWQVRCYPADWERYGLGAGPIRNNQMLEQDPEHVFIFWDQRSRGTKHVLDAVRDRRIPHTLVTA